MMMRAGRLGIRQREGDGRGGRGGKCVAVHHGEDSNTKFRWMRRNCEINFAAGLLRYLLDEYAHRPGTEHQHHQKCAADRNAMRRHLPISARASPSASHSAGEKGLTNVSMTLPTIIAEAAPMPETPKVSAVKCLFLSHIMDSRYSFAYYGAMKNTVSEPDRQLFVDLVPPLVEWMQSGFDLYRNTSFPSKRSANGSAAVCTHVLKDCFLAGGETRIGPATINLTGAYRSPSLSIVLNTENTQIVLRSAKSIDLSWNGARPATRVLDPSEDQMVLIDRSDVIEFDNRVPSKFATIAWSYSEVKDDEGDRNTVLWNLEMYFSRIGESVQTARFENGFRCTIEAGHSVKEIEPFIPSDEQLIFLADEGVERGEIS